jgi:hypothetical protein
VRRRGRRVPRLHLARAVQVRLQEPDAALRVRRRAELAPHSGTSSLLQSLRGALACRRLFDSLFTKRKILLVPVLAQERRTWESGPWSIAFMYALISGTQPSR